MNPLRWLKNHLRELIVLTFAALLLVNVPAAVRALFDPTAGELDGSVFQLFAWTGLLCLGCVVLLWVVISVAFPTINRHLDSGRFKTDFLALGPKERATLTLWTLTLVLGLIAVCVIASHLTATPAVNPPPMPPPPPLEPRDQSAEVARQQTPAVLTMARAKPAPSVVAPAPAPRVLTDRELLLAVAASQIGTTEKSGRNDGPVEKYLLSVGLEKGDPYCAAFLYWCGREALGARNPFPRSGWSPDFVSRPDWLRGKGVTPAAGDTFGIWFSDKQRVAHTGLVAGLRGKSIETIEANTSPAKSTGEADRNGDGVWRKIRPLSTIHSTKRWLP
jgi:hypothetical protein